ncbi:hypothetical protein RN001_008035 [Aquatica leii]|uniref:CUB domain-containing protein n=1 Tax=Aquatica leii TaxID=1421715 RepID=A0AAN7PX37_9COLE|nr:hypothetical protein RN001_008035 [Aquatica leii]
MYMHVWLILNVVLVFIKCFNYVDDGTKCNRTFTESKIIISVSKNESVHTDCYYNIKGPECPTVYNFHFVNFNLTPSHQCNLDRLEISNKEILCGKVSGVKTYSSDTGDLKLHLVTKNVNLKILITRLPCYTNLKSRINFDSKTVSTLNQQVPDPLSFCCSTHYNLKHFYLSSPNFLYSSSKENDCVYRIYKLSHKVCRLRINFLYFWLGEHLSGNACNKGYIELDGKFICGCRTGLKLISAFDPINQFKTIRLQNLGFPQTVIRGFILEVMQDECPERISSAVQKLNFASNVNETFREFQGNYITKARLVKDQKYVNYLFPQVVNHVYVFEDSEEHKDKEETTYINTSDYEMQSYNDFDIGECNNLGLAQLRMLSTIHNWKEITQCNKISNPLTLQCTIANFVQGYIQSPQYPYYYPEGLHICFRFERQVGYCGVRLYFHDFDIVRSYDCKKDYLLVANKVRYCGRALYNAGLTFDLRSHAEEIIFVSKGYTCGRGFKAVYEQIPCNNIEFSTSPVYPLSTTPYPSINTPPIISNLKCNRNIEDSTFLLEVYSYNQPKCIFNIFKNNENVCRLSLQLVNFNLLCEYEYLIIENKIYCGELDNNTINIQFNHYQLPITYVRASATPDLSSLRFRITGLQMTEECDIINIPEVQPERIHIQNASLKENPEIDICGILLNVTDAGANQICEVLQKYDNTTICHLLDETAMYIPYKFYEELKLDLQIHNVEMIDVQEISCANVSKILT